jgi:hemolysin III
MIAGTYTPLTLVRMGSGWGVGIAAFVWLVAIVGIAMNLFFPLKFGDLSIVIYLALGWTILVGIRPLLDTVPLPAIVMLGVGGLLYSVGILFHVWRSLPYQNALWHGFVLSAAACQWLAIMNGVVRAG